MVSAQNECIFLCVAVVRTKDVFVNMPKELLMNVREHVLISKSAIVFFIMNLFYLIVECVMGICKDLSSNCVLDDTYKLSSAFLVSLA